MINQISDVLNAKTIDQYKIIEEKYEILRTYLLNALNNRSYISKKQIELILNSLDCVLVQTGVEENKDERNIRSN